MDQPARDQLQKSIMKGYIHGMRSLISFYQTDIEAFDAGKSEQKKTESER